MGRVDGTVDHAHDQTERGSDASRCQGWNSVLAPPQTVCLPGRMLELVAIAGPPVLLSRRKVAVAGRKAGRAVDQLADDVGVPAWRSMSAMTCTRIRCSVTSRLSSGHHETDPIASRGSASMVGVGVRPRPAVQPDDVVARLLGSRPHVGVGLGALVEPRPSVRRSAFRTPHRSSRSRLLRRA